MSYYCLADLYSLLAIESGYEHYSFMDNQTPDDEQDEQQELNSLRKIQQHHTHDRFSKRMLSDPARARELLQTCLPTEISEKIDWSTLQLLNTEYIDKELNRLNSDLLFSVDFNGNESYIHTLIEHQSTNNRWMALRILDYMTSIWRPYMKEEAEHLPPIFPLVLYQGEQAWTAPAEFIELFDPQHTSAVAQYIPNFRHEILNLPETDWENLQTGLMMKFLLGAMQSAHSHNVNKLVNFINTHCDEILEKGDEDSLKTTMIYLFSHNERAIFNQIQKALNPNLSNIMTSAVEEFYREGRQEGRQEGEKRGKQKGKLEALQLLIDSGMSEAEARKRLKLDL